MYSSECFLTPLRRGCKRQRLLRTFKDRYKQETTVAVVLCQRLRQSTLNYRVRIISEMYSQVMNSRRGRASFCKAMATVKSTMVQHMALHHCIK